MTTAEMMSKIGAFSADQRKQENERKMADEKELRGYLKEIQGIVQDLRDIRPVVAALYANGILKFNAAGSFGADRFLTDGINHGYGFSHEGCAFNGTQTVGNFYGREGGGCCGADFFINLDTGAFIAPSLRSDSVGMTLEELVEKFDNRKYADYAKHLVPAARKMIAEVEEIVKNLK